jgi:hypothetical protein
MTADTSRRGTRVALGAAFVSCCVLAVLIAAAVWQGSVHDSRVSEADTHDTTASLLQDAKTEGSVAGDTMTRYVATGDVTLLPDLKAHTTLGVQKLSAAVASAGEDPNGFLAAGSQFLDSSGQIIAKRQTGDVQGAVAALKEVGPKYTAFIAAQEQVITSERAEAASLRESADSASTASSRFGVGAALVGIGMILAVALFVGRQVRRHRVVGSTTLSA